MPTIVDLMDYIVLLRQKIQELEAQNKLLQQNLNNDIKKK